MRALKSSSWGLMLAGLLLAIAMPPAGAQQPPAAPAPDKRGDSAPAATQPAGLIDASDAPVSPSGEAVARIIVNLDHEDFAVRKMAATRLNSLGGEALPAVEAALAGGLTSAESRIRLQAAAKILRARARLEKLARERLDWKKALFFESYKASGNTHPAYDEAVRTAMTLFLQLGGDPARGPPELRKRALDAFKSATEAGCKDPLVGLMYQFTLGHERNLGPSFAPLEFHLQTSIDRFIGQTKYPAVIKFWTIWRAIRLVDRLTMSRVAVQATGLIPEILATPGLPPNELEVNAHQLYDAISAQLLDARAFEPFLKAYAAAQPDAAGPIIMKARMAIDHAEIRRQHNDSAGMAAKLNEAAGFIEEAWKRDPTHPMPPTMMITVLMGQGMDGEDRREALELWFTRAMDANPDNYEACRRKLVYLQWRTTEQEMLEFGRWCLKTENWRGNIPFILAAAHNILAERSNDRKVYFAQPQVWEDLRGVYEGCVINFPDAVIPRNQYAKIATEAGRWDIAHEQFQILGDQAMPEVFGGQATLDYYKRKAARLAKAAGASAGDH